jgi:hypothetical protein
MDEKTKPYSFIVTFWDAAYSAGTPCPFKHLSLEHKIVGSVDAAGC